MPTPLRIERPRRTRLKIWHGGSRVNECIECYGEMPGPFACLESLKRGVEWTTLPFGKDQATPLAIASLPNLVQRHRCLAAAYRPHEAIRIQVKHPVCVASPTRMKGVTE